MHTLTHTATGRRRVLLHNDNYNRREYVVRVLLKVVEGFTVDEAVNCMQVWCAVADAALVRTHGRAGRRWLRRGGAAVHSRQLAGNGGACCALRLHGMILPECSTVPLMPQPLPLWPPAPLRRRRTSMGWPW